MKKLFILAIIFWMPLIAKSQDLTELKKHNVFFILFEEDEFSQKMKLMPKEKEIYSYEFFYKKKNSPKKTPYAFVLFYNQYGSHDDAAKGINQKMMYRVHKSFLKKNKDIIITRKFIERVGENKIIGLLYDSNKHVFIIDKSEMSNKKIVIREVRFSPNLYE